MTGHDEKISVSVANARARNHLAETLITDTLKTYIVSVDGDTSRNNISQFVDALPARESRTLRKCI